MHGLLLRDTESFDEHDKAQDQLTPEGNGMILEEADSISTCICWKCVVANSSFLTMGCMAGKTPSECANAQKLLPEILHWWEVPRQEEGRFPQLTLQAGARFIFSSVRC